MPLGTRRVHGMFTQASVPKMRGFSTILTLANERLECSFFFYNGATKHHRSQNVSKIDLFHLDAALVFGVFGEVPLLYSDLCTLWCKRLMLRITFQGVYSR